ncbi:C-type lectin domain family 4 member G-like isoform X2 [Haliotis rufescens]|uniref:C-type lectin domain family 4 member G-like isoform X2 n=1 Tax=Haliotis rufescens TaxID=6454 RepID=UPI00201F104A|nr:C-type lectin domain family 4 member G-like isoform X2 [Haliotis rufescens]
MTRLLCVVLAVVVAVNGQNGNDLSRCPSNLKRNQYLYSHGEYCYEFAIAEHRYWKGARDYCVADGGHLVKIDNMDKELFLVSTLLHLDFHDKAIWIGLNDIQQEGVYTWTNGELATFTYWAPGEPSFLHNFEDCVAMKVTDSGHWHDFPCELISDAFGSICQYDMLPKPTDDPGLIIGQATAGKVTSYNQHPISYKPSPTTHILPPTTHKPTDDPGLNIGQATTAGVVPVTQVNGGPITNGQQQTDAPTVHSTGSKPLIG